MLPNQLDPASFAAYPEQARRIATSRIAVLKRLPLGFVPLLLRELIAYDWKFPAERREIDGQFAYLSSLAAGPLAKAMEPFSRLRLAPALENLDWVNLPAIFSEQLTAHLWTSRQIDAFRAGATAYMRAATAAQPEERLPMRRLGIAAIGQGVERNEYRLFRKLRPRGVYYSRVKPENGVPALVDAVAKRAAASPLPYGHWLIDGSAGSAAALDGVTTVSYGALSGPRSALQLRMQKVYEASVFDPEAFRTRMALTQPAEIGLREDGDAVMARFQLSLLTEGSGTQVFATTFVQWAAREALRRAQPVTLMTRFGPRQRENPMNVLLAEGRRKPELDPQGSLIDADMGAYYTWLNQQRLAGAEDAAFLVWFENHSEAVAIGPGMAPGARSDTVIELTELVARLS
jgi:hypothetical protein